MIILGCPHIQNGFNFIAVPHKHSYTMEDLGKILEPEDQGIFSKDRYSSITLGLSITQVVVGVIECTILQIATSLCFRTNEVFSLVGAGVSTFLYNHSSDYVCVYI